MRQLKRFLKKAHAWYYTHIRGVKKNRVLFVSFNGKSYSDNPKVVSEALHKECPEAQIVWLFTDPKKKKEIVPAYVKTVNIKSASAYYKALYTSRVLVTNFLLPKVQKRDNQMFIQTWHGDRAFKKVLLDATHSHVNEQEEGYCDLAIAGSDYGERQYRSAFAYKGEVIKVGTPRDDAFINPDKEKIASIRRSLGIKDGCRILLYAPTLRDKARDDGVKQDLQSIDLQRTLEALERKYACEWICFVRAHPGVIGLNGVESSEKMKDVSSYEDMSDLLLIADLLITDYSSSAGDFALLERPLILFHSDIEDYSTNTRALYFDVAESPYYRAHTQDELENIIDSLRDEDVKKNCKDILDFYCTNESGNAAYTIARLIKDFIKK